MEWVFEIEGQVKSIALWDAILNTVSALCCVYYVIEVCFAYKK